MTATGLASLQTDALVNLGAVVAPTIELAPATAGGTMTLGASGSGLSLPSTAGMTATNLLVGGVTQPGGLAPVVTAGAITVAGTFSAAGVTTLDLDTTGAISQSAPLINVATLAASAADVMLGNSGNLIGTSAGITATSGNVVLVDGGNLILNGSYSGDDLFFEVAAAGGTLTVGGSGPASLTAGTRISLVADTLVANSSGLIGDPGGTVELATFSASNLSLAGVSGSLSGRQRRQRHAGDRWVHQSSGWRFSDRHDGGLDRAGRRVQSDGSRGHAGIVGEWFRHRTGRPIDRRDHYRCRFGGFSLINSGNQIQTSSGIVASGNVVLVDGATSL